MNGAVSRRRESGRLNSVPHDCAFGGLWVIARDERVAVTFAETDRTEADDGRVRTDLKVPSVWCANEEGEESDGEVRSHGDDGRGSKVKGGDSRKARSGGRHEAR